MCLINRKSFPWMWKEEMIEASGRDLLLAAAGLELATPSPGGHPSWAHTPLSPAQPSCPVTAEREAFLLWRVACSHGVLLLSRWSVTGRRLSRQIETLSVYGGKVTYFKKSWLPPTIPFVACLCHPSGTGLRKSRLPYVHFCSLKG